MAGRSRQRRFVLRCVAAVLTLSATSLAQEEPPAPAEPMTPAPPPVDAPAPEPQPAPAPPPASPAPPAPAPPSKPTTEPAAPVQPAAPRARPPRFGAKGEVVVTAGVDVSVGSSTFDNSAAEKFFVTFAPGAHYFIVDNLSIGLDVSVGYSEGRSYGADGSLVATESTTLAAGPRVGFNVPLGRLVSFYPRLTLGLESVHRAERVVEGTSPSTAGNPLGIPSTTRVGPYASLFVPILLHPSPHVFIEAGPSLFHELGRAQGGPEIGGQRTTIGAGIGIGTWWGGKSEPSPPNRQEEAHEPAPARFGDQGTVVLGGGIGGSYSAYAGTSSYTGSFSIGPAVDYFIVERLSVGVGVRYNLGRTRTLQPSGLDVRGASEGVSLTPRIGFDFPIATWCSLYPQTTLSFGFNRQELSTGGSLIELDETRTTFGAYVPLLFHVASHAFVGFGPYLSRDLSRKADITSTRTPLGGLPVTLSGESAYPGTSLGASAVVGGWL